MIRRKTKAVRALQALIGLALIGLLCGPAQAAFLESQGGKSGPFMFNLKLGPSIPAFINGLPSGISALDVIPAEFAMMLEFGFAFDRDRSAYLLFPFQFEVATQRFAIPFFGSVSSTLTTVIVPVGFQYDIPIAAVPGLYLYPRISIGYAAFISSNGSSSNTINNGVLIPEFGIKYVLRKRINLGFEPFSLPMFFNGEDNGNFRLEYRLLVYGGLNF